MYKMGPQFEIDTSMAISNPENVYKGKNYRITVLTDRLIRLEYNTEGDFVDEPSIFALNRKFDKVEVKVQDERKLLQLTTKYFKLMYTKEKEFSRSSIKVLLNSTDKMWYFGHPEVRNYFGTTSSLENMEEKLKLKKGLYSADGFVSIDDSNSLVYRDGIFNNRETKGIDIYLFMYRKDFGLCLNDYFKLTGFPPMLPRYAFGNWWSKEYDYNEKDINELVKKFEKESIPLSAILLDKDWHKREIGEEKKAENGYEFNNKLFPYPKNLTNYLHLNNIKLGLRIDPIEGLYDNTNLNEELKKIFGLDSKLKAPLNLINPEMIDMYFKAFVNPVEDLGVDFWWIDSKVEDKNKKRVELLSHYHYLDSNKDEKKRGLILAPNASSASHRYTALYSGKTTVSWDTLKVLPYFNSSAANIGISYWSNDIGGAKDGMEDPELYIRYVELGCFSPIFRFHTVRGPYYKREPWKWDPKAKSIAKKYMNLRHRLIPYIYSASYNYHSKGMPIIQPIYYKYPEMFDDIIYKNEYYLGSELLIAPIIEKKNEVMNRTIKKVFIPEGTWFDFETGKSFPGGKAYTTFYKEEDYPVFCRSGSIIPFSTEDELDASNPPTKLEIHVFPGRSNTYELYEDDGYSNLYKKDYFIITSFDYTYQKNNYTLIIRPTKGKKGIIPSKRDYKIRFRNSREPEEINIYENANQASFRSYTEESDLIIELKDISTLSQITISCKGEDMTVSANRIINDEIDSIISDLEVKTKLKEEISEVIFSDLPIRKKRIEVRKLRSKKLERRFVKLFLKLLEYMEEI